jgi:hypothetical protein
VRRDDVAAYVEVPDAGFMLRELAVWDVIFEHPWYFTAPALRRLFTEQGFRVLATQSSFAGQFLSIEAALGSAEDTDDDAEIAELTRRATDFGWQYRRLVADWGATLRERLGAGQRIAVWGMGSKGVTFLNAVDGGQDVQVAVDLNPRKHGRYVPGTGQRVVGPDVLSADPVDALLVMNPIYTDEIARRLEDLGTRPELLTVHDGASDLSNRRP